MGKHRRLASGRQLCLTNSSPLTAAIPRKSQPQWQQRKSDRNSDHSFSTTVALAIEWIEGRRYLGLDVLARSRNDKPTDSTGSTEEVTPALTA